MELLNTKIIAVLALGISTLFVGLLPACFSKQSTQWPLLLSSMLCFGGGVLLSTSIVHILPELREDLPDHAELIFCAGFFILYLLDEVVHYFYGETHDGEIISVFNGSHSHSPLRRHSSHYGSTEKDPLVMEHRQPPYNPSFFKARSESYLIEEDRAPSQLCHVGHQEPCHTTPTVNIGLLVALSVHALLEGLVVGLESLPHQVLLLLGAIASHKLVVGFVLGVELASNTSTTYCRHFTCIFIFTLGSVAGIILGMIITNTQNDFITVIIPILQGLAGGTLLYVTVSEIIPRERARWHQQHNQKSAGIFQFISVAFGFVLMTIVTKYLDYDGH
ncbi:unnamed protein product [Brassicogethes aeneus]|uniref:Zinc transporter ZIP3 n=1 Tax=Brassicogethes aeneus TaxID=1431903 RepID=A0A9P0B0L7_BRAAE|nr:unnamed protein product [Brassicogethes aeneus]